MEPHTTAQKNPVTIDLKETDFPVRIEKKGLDLSFTQLSESANHDLRSFCFELSSPSGDDRATIQVSGTHEKVVEFLHELITLPEAPIPPRALHSILQGAEQGGITLSSAAGQSAYEIAAHYAELRGQIPRHDATPSSLVTIDQVLSGAHQLLGPRASILLAGGAGYTASSVASSVLQGNHSALFTSIATYAISFVAFWGVYFPLARSGDRIRLLDSHGLIDERQWNGERKKDVPFVICTESVSFPARILSLRYLLDHGYNTPAANALSAFLAGTAVFLLSKPLWESWLPKATSFLSRKGSEE